VHEQQTNRNVTVQPWSMNVKQKIVRGCAAFNINSGAFVMPFETRQVLKPVSFDQLALD